MASHRIDFPLSVVLVDFLSVYTFFLLKMTMLITPVSRFFYILIHRLYWNCFQVKGGDPLLKLVAVDWLKAENALDKVALRTSCMVQVRYQVLPEILGSYVELTKTISLHLIEL